MNGAQKEWQMNAKRRQSMTLVLGIHNIANAKATGVGKHGQNGNVIRQSLMPRSGILDRSQTWTQMKSTMAQLSYCVICCCCLGCSDAHSNALCARRILSTASVSKQWLCTTNWLSMEYYIGVAKSSVQVVLQPEPKDKKKLTMIGDT